MRFECDSCNAKYKISDDKVRGRVVRFPCRKCEYKILIDGRHADADVTVPAGAAYRFDEITRKSEPVSGFSAHEVPTARASRPSSAARRSSIPARRRPPSVPPRRPSAASRISSLPAATAATVATAATSAALAGQHPGLAPPVPAAVPVTAGDVPEWHVSINDVPIGPIRLEEMAHKIDAGAVSEYSLVWREGFGEWRPLATVPELMSALHERRHSGPPSRSSFSSMPPFVETRTSFSDPAPASAPASAPAPAPLAALPVPPSSFPGDATVGSNDNFAPLADVLQPEVPEVGLDQMSQPPAPIGPEAVFQSSPRLGSYSGLPPSPSDQVSVPSVPPEPAASTAEPKRRLSLGILALIVAVAVFSGVVAFLAFDRFGEELMQKWVTGGEPAAVAAPAPKKGSAPIGEAEVEASAEGTPEAEPVPALQAAADDASEATEAEVAEPGDGSEAGDGAEAAEETAGAGAEETDAKAAVVPPPDPSDNAPKIAPVAKPKPRAARRTRAKPVAQPEPEPKSELSASDQKILDEFGSGANAAPAKIDVQKSGSTQSKKAALDGDGVRATVTTNKPRLQRCYERAIRGQQSPPSVRLDISVMVAPSGRVKNVTSEGSGPGGLAECVEASVRRWRFPDSAEGGPARFPIVFSAN